MATRTTFERVQERVADCLYRKPSEITLETRLMIDLGADSLDVVELCMMVEEEFDIEIADEEIVNWMTVKDVVDYIEGL